MFSLTKAIHDYPVGARIVGALLTLSCLFFAVDAMAGQSLPPGLMDYFIAHRLSDPVVDAQKRFLTYKLLNHKKRLGDSLPKVFFYRGLCNFYQSNFREAEADFQQAWMMDEKMVEYKVHADVASCLKENRSGDVDADAYDRIAGILESNKTFAPSVFCRLRGPDALRHLIPGDRAAEAFSKPQGLEDLYLGVRLLDRPCEYEDPSSLVKGKDIGSVILYDPYTLFYLGHIFRSKLEEIQTPKPWGPDGRGGGFKRIYLYLYTNYIIHNKAIPEEDIRVLRNRKFPDHKRALLETCFHLAGPDPDYARAYDVCKPFVESYPPTQPGFDPNSYWYLYFMDYAILAHYCHDISFANENILKRPLFLERYRFFIVSSYYLTAVLYQ